MVFSGRDYNYSRLLQPSPLSLDLPAAPLAGCPGTARRLSVPEGLRGFPHREIVCFP